MRVAIHQPHFLPWIGYLDRIQKADLFILLDHVQYESQNYQNRVLIKTGEGSQWVIVPLFQRSQQERIIDKIINNQRQGRLSWQRKIWKTVQRAYQGAPYFKAYAGPLQELLEARWHKLIDLNLALLQFLNDAFGIRTRMVRSSELVSSGKKSDLVLSLCQAVKADAFLGGMGGSREYLNEARFAEAGIAVQWQDFRHPVYRQHPQPDRFVKGLSAIDLLFNWGPQSADILTGAAASNADPIIPQPAL